MTPLKGKEKLSNFLEVNEIKKLEKDNPEKYKILLEKIHLLTDTQKEIAELKKELVWNISLDEKVDKILWFIKEEETQSPIEKAKEKAQKELEKNKDKLEKELREKVDKKLPLGIGWSIFDWGMDLIKSWEDKEASFFDKIFSKIWLFILGLLGVKKGYEKLKDMKAEDFIKNEWKTTDTSSKPNETLLEWIDEWKEENNFYYFSWMNILMHFSWNKADNSKDSLEKMRDKKYSEISNINKSILWEKPSSLAIDNFNNTKESLISEDSRALIKSSLSKEKVAFILEKNENFINWKIKWERISELKDMISKNKFDHEKLTLNEISILLFAWTNTLWILGLSQTKNIFEWVKGYLTDDNGMNFDNMKDELITKRKWLISDRLFKWFTELWWDFWFWWKTYLDNETLRKKFEKYPQEDKNQLEKIINFKDWLLNWFLNENKNLLVELDYNEDFKNSLDYRWVILLYLALAWNESLDKSSSFDLSAIYKIISTIINWWDHWKWSAYLSSVVEYIASEDKNNIFTKEEKKWLEIVWSKLTLDWLRISVNQLKDKLWFTQILFNDNIAWSVWTTVAGYGIFKYAWRIIPQARLLWLTISWLWLTSLFTDMYWMKSSLLDDIRSLDIAWKKDLDLGDYKKQIDKINNNIKTEEIEVDWKNEKVSYYSWKKWLEVIYKNEIYRLDTWPNPLDKDFSLSDIWSQLPSEKIISSDIDNYKWKEIDFSQISFSKDKIIFWTWDDVLTLDNSKIKESLKKYDIKNPKKLFSDEDYIDMEYLVVEKNNTKVDSFLLVDLINERFKNDLILVKVWKVEQKQN